MAQVPVAALRFFGVAALDSTTSHGLAEGTELIQFRSLAAVVAPAPKYARVVLDADEMRDYARVLEEVQSNGAVLPAPPGTVFRSRDSLMRWLELHYFTLTQTMGAIEGHGQARLTITKTSGVDPANATGAEAKESAKQLMATASQSIRVLRGQAAATVMLSQIEGETRVVARASFLVELDHWTAFSELVAKEDQRQTALDFHLSGPWPPYDFVRMKFGG
jgi:hypothetical protein